MIDSKNSQNSRNTIPSKVLKNEGDKILFYIGLNKDGNVDLEICEVCNKILGFDFASIKSFN